MCHTPEQSLRFILVVFLPHNRQVCCWINIPVYRSVILHSLFPGQFPFQLSAMLFYSSLISASVSSAISSPSALLYHTHNWQGRTAHFIMNMLFNSRYREREGGGGAVLVDVSSDSKCRGEGKGLDVITQDCCCRQEWGGEQARLPVRQKWWLRPHITVQSISKQIISAVQHNRGRQAQPLWEELKLRLS